ncbi:hypothetical protein D3Z50_07915 [Clostridiaceae bacterium]|nr:hypothetical protein [Clostridiaceae bacterium]
MPARACLKNHSRHLHAPLCGIFGPNSLNAAHCAAFIWPKSPIKWNAHLAESIFQTRSKACFKPLICACGFFSDTLKYKQRGLHDVTFPVTVQTGLRAFGADRTNSVSIPNNDRRTND